MNNIKRFSRDHKLVTKAEYQSIFDQPIKVSQKYFLALFKPNKKTYGRLGLIIGKRIANSAVVRNKIKRVIRESFRVNQVRLKSLDIIIVAKHQCDTLDKIKLREGIDRLWEKLLLHFQNSSP